AEVRNSRAPGPDILAVPRPPTAVGAVHRVDHVAPPESDDPRGVGHGPDHFLGHPANSRVDLAVYRTAHPAIRRMTEAVPLRIQSSCDPQRLQSLWLEAR